MTKLAAYEAGEGKKDTNLNSYFRGDYMSFQIWKSAIYGTAGFCVYVALTILYDLENFLEEFYKMDMVSYFQDLLVKYAVVVSIYVVISYFVCLYRYTRGKKHVNRYLKALSELYSKYSR
ncbi:MAG: hypothetical protein K5931_11220 [Lachnospiraceae bacterium]|nr:hypothetical protein [Lachnospiraceae bacterium]